jgi:RNA polymerase primary sigma factor
LERTAKTLGLSAEQTDCALRANRPPVSLDQSLENRDDCLGDLVPDGRKDETASRIDREQLKSHLAHALTVLNDREREIISLRYGLADGQMHTLGTIGNMFSITRERVRQIELRALEKLRRTRREHKLHGFLEQSESGPHRASAYDPRAVDHVEQKPPNGSSQPRGN